VAARGAGVHADGAIGPVITALLPIGEAAPEADDACGGVSVAEDSSLSAMSASQVSAS